jgi:hypothetical protein
MNDFKINTAVAYSEQTWETNRPYRNNNNSSSSSSRNHLPAILAR